MTVFINGISSSGKSQAMIYGSDKLDGVSKRIENDHLPIKNAFMDQYDKRIGNQNYVNVSENRNVQNVNDEKKNDDDLNDENLIDENDDNDVPMRDMTPFVTVQQAKTTVDARINISYNRRTFTQVCNSSFVMYYFFFPFLPFLNFK